MQRASNGHTGSPAQHKVHVIGIHSDRGGAGKTTLAANLAYLVARTGAKVAVLDADLHPYTAELERIARHCLPIETGAGVRS